MHKHCQLFILCVRGIFLKVYYWNFSSCSLRKEHVSATSAFLCWLLQNWNKYVYSWRSIDWHCYDNNIHAILDNEPVCGNLDLQLKVVQRDRIKFVHFGLYLDIYIKVVKPTLYRKVLPSTKAAKLYCAFVWLVSILLAILFLRGWVGMQ